jgi:hypothetical protein
MAVLGSQMVRLAVGVTGPDGMTYRDVVIDEIRGIDTANMSSPKNSKNAARQMTALLQRCVQEIPGVMPKKVNPQELGPADIFRKMTTYDRDLLVFAILALGEDTRSSHAMVCPSCGHKDSLEYDLLDAECADWPDDAPQEIELELPRGLYVDGAVRRNIVWRFTTGMDAETMFTVPDDKRLQSMVAASIKSVEGVDRPISSSEIGMMTTADLGFLTSELGPYLPGLILEREVVCDNCGHEFTHRPSLDGFFGSRRSAPPQQKHKPKTLRRR